MVNGKMQCLGDVQRIKSKYGQGLRISIKLKDIPVADPLEASLEPKPLPGKSEARVSQTLEETVLGQPQSPTQLAPPPKPEAFAPDPNRVLAFDAEMKRVFNPCEIQDQHQVKKKPK